MFVYDEQLTTMILDYCRWRLALDPVPLDFGGAQASSLAASLGGLINHEGTDPRRVMDVFDGELATAVVSCDSPRFLSFIPAAPTKASLLFDMVVACSSLQGTSWLEAAGAVAAENQALGVLADLAGLPRGAGGCFVSGGSAGNLSALMVARDTATHRMGDRSPHRPLMAVSEEAHSSVGKALRVLGVEALLVPCEDHRLTGAGLQSALESQARGADVIAVVATAGTTNAGIIDDLDGVGQIARQRSLWFHVDGAYGCAALFAPSVRDRFAGIEMADSFVVDPHKWLFAPFDCAVLVYREAQSGQGRPHPGRLLPRRTPQRRPGRVESQRLRLPPDEAGSWPTALVLTGSQRHGRLSRRIRNRARRYPAVGRSHRTLALSRAGASARIVGCPVPSDRVASG